MKSLVKFASLVATLAVCQSLFASTTVVVPPTFVTNESVTFTGVDSFAGLGDPGNTTLSATLTGGVVSPDLQVIGTLTEVALGTFAGEANIDIQPLGFNSDPAGTTGGYVGSIGVSSVVPFGLDPAGTQTFEFYESFIDDAAGVDQTWDTVTFNFGELTDPGSTTIVDGKFAIGTIAPDGMTVCGGGQVPNAFHSNVNGGLDFFTIDITDAVGGGGYLHIATSDPVSGDTIDTELAIFDAAGVLVAFDDDGQATAAGGLYSVLSFGTSDPLAPATDAPAGEDGTALPAGTYTVVVGGFDTNFEDLTIGTSLIGDVTPGISAGDYDICFTHAVPEPGAFALLAIAGLAGLWFRRR